jgi:hypothetical protein
MLELLELVVARRNAIIGAKYEVMGLCPQTTPKQVSGGYGGVSPGGTKPLWGYGFYTP